MKGISCGRFVDWQLDILNEQTFLNAGVTIVRPINTDFPPSLNTQDGLYTTLIRGLNAQGESGERGAAYPFGE
ncbi:altronate oxidoreductase [Citrobacter freundii]|nr:altronate oxidoreductase [Citrobacter freundii]